MSSRLRRLLWLDERVRAGAYPAVADVCEQFQVGERTVFNDVAFLRHVLGAPLVYRRQHGGYEYANPAWQFPAPFRAPAAAPAWSWLLDELERRLGPEAAGELLAGFVARLSESEKSG